MGKIKIMVAGSLTAALMVGVVGTASATSTVTAVQAKANYESALASAKATFLAAVRPSRNSVFERGKKSEAVRRATVKRALAEFNAVVAAEKAPSLLAEKNYKASVAASLASPSNASLKATVKANLAKLTSLSSALSTDVKITSARAAFAKARTNAMAKFKLSLSISAKERARTLARATTRYKAEKARAYAVFQASLKAAAK